MSYFFSRNRNKVVYILVLEYFFVTDRKWINSNEVNLAQERYVIYTIIKSFVCSLFIFPTLTFVNKWKRVFSKEEQHSKALLVIQAWTKTFFVWKNRIFSERFCQFCMNLILNLRLNRLPSVTNNFLGRSECS